MICRRQVRGAFALACLALGVASPAQGPRLRLLQPGPEPLRAWVDCAIPYDPDLPDASWLQVGPDPGTRWIVVRGRDLGTHSTMVHVLAALPGGRAIEGSLVPADADSAPDPIFLRRWLPDPPQRDAVPELLLELSEGTFHRLRYERMERIEDGSARRVFHLRSAVEQGWVADAWLYQYSAQDLARFECTLTWSDRQSPDTRRGLVQVLLRAPQPFALHYRTRMGASPIVRNEDRLWSTRLSAGRTFGDGEQIAWSGELLPGKVPDEAAETARAWLETRARAPAAGVCLDWQGHWLAFGRVPRVPSAPGAVGEAGRRAQAFARLLQQPADPWSDRPLGLARFPGQTGDQEDFGATKGSMAVSLGDPRWLHEARYAETGYFRGFHHRRADGSRLRADDHPEWVTWSMATHEASTGDFLGKTRGGDRRGSGWLGMDDQHRSQLNSLALYALSGSHMLEGMFRDAVETDRAQPKKRSGAPRAIGRLYLTWANMLALGFDGIEARMERKLEDVLALWPGRRVAADSGRTVRALGTVTDPRALRAKDGTPRRCVVIWEHGLAAIGLHAAWRVTGDPRYRELAEATATLVVQHGYFETEGGRLATASHILYREGEDEGLPPPADAYFRGSDQVVVDGTFWEWTLPSARILLELYAEDPDHPIAVRAARIVQQFASTGPQTWRQAEWWALGPEDR